MQFETVIYEKVDDIAIIRLNRPKVLNAINVQLTRDFHQALAEAALDSTVKGVIIKGEGRAFCAGVDLKFATEELKTLQDQQDLFREAGKGPDQVFDLSSFLKMIHAANRGDDPLDGPLAFPAVLDDLEVLM